MISEQVLNDCLDALGAIFHVKIVPMIFDRHYNAVIDFDDAQITAAYTKAMGDRSFPATARILEIINSENVDVDVPPVFEATSKLRASNYNDQTFVVSP